LPVTKGTRRQDDDEPHCPMCGNVLLAVSQRPDGTIEYEHSDFHAREFTRACIDSVRDFDAIVAELR
jgi:hypothetical protein